MQPSISARSVRTQLNNRILQTAAYSATTISEMSCEGMCWHKCGSSQFSLAPRRQIQAFQHAERRSITDSKTVQYLNAWSYREWFRLPAFAAGPAHQYICRGSTDRVQIVGWLVGKNRFRQF